MVRVLDAAREVTRRLEPLTAVPLQPARADVRAQLARLVYPGFVAATGIDRLADVERYLRAAARRLERLPDATAVDRDRMNSVHELERAYRERLAACPGAAAPARGAVDARGAARQPLRPVARHPRPGVGQADPARARGGRQ